MIRFNNTSFAIILMAALMTSCGTVPDSGDRFALKGYQALNEGRYEEAAQALETSIQKGLSDQNLEVAYTCLGNAYNELDEYEKAFAAYKKALKINPESYEVWVNLGIIFRLTDQLVEAEKCYMKALELQPDYAELHTSIGALYIFQEKYEQAVHHLEKATTLNKQLPGSWANLALAYATVGRFSEADAALKRAVVLGYMNGTIIQERINNLKDLSDANKENANKAFQAIGDKSPQPEP